MKKRWYFILVTGLLLLLFLNLYLGSVRISVHELCQILIGKKNSLHAGLQAGGSTDPNTGMHVRIVKNIRLPRALGAMLLGGALSLSGYLLQTFFSNPIAGPFVLGISHGAKLMVALTMIALIREGITVYSVTLVLAAFAGSMLSMLFILLVSTKIQKMSVLVICGVMIGYICSSVTDFVVTFADDANIINLHNWSLGSFSGMTMENVRTIAVVVFCCTLLVLCLSKQISAYQLGETHARSLGLHIRRFRGALIVLSGILSAVVTAYAGPVSFVGIAVPHMIRLMFKTTKPVVMVTGCLLGGGVFCLFCDLIARTVFAPTELSISSVTAIFGAPVVIMMMLKKENR